MAEESFKVFEPIAPRHDGDVSNVPPPKTPWRRKGYTESILDRIDERRACELREKYGQRRRLLSWHPEPDGRWRARVSGPGVDLTVERTGRNRVEAARSAARALDGILVFRFNFAPGRLLALKSRIGRESNTDPTSP